MSLFWFSYVGEVFGWCILEKSLKLLLLVSNNDSMYEKSIIYRVLF